MHHPTSYSHCNPSCVATVVTVAHCRQAIISLKCDILPLAHCLIIDYNWQITKKPSKKYYNILTPPQRATSPKPINVFIDLYIMNSCT